MQHFRKTGRPRGRRWREEKFIEEIEEASVVQERREKEVNSVRRCFEGIIKNKEDTTKSLILAQDER